ncbi:RagB/SusD family nutrient uptake outer membrane protein [Fulvivirga sp. M361]|uniref:RagB/SusD family nutrient uptake outer membrane protein n=1 Tax=Fulvivirga sp. M361 TaxID=2594266 RepID=UPI00117A0156|nr:RagB/SusD family nutrient uptake outer membrane protein [Fulvivirga sp. M361]TRX53055.1 RagB/SusD family nutrient uptake outer membrane protein [Fulvivirga sp. M361]
MKNISSKIYYIIVGGLLVSCNDFLDLSPVTEISSANYWQTQEDAEAGIIGCYDALQPDSYFGFDLYTYGEVRSDNCFAGGDNPNNFAIDNFTENPTNANITRSWRQLYFAIGRTNTVLNRVNGMEDDLFEEAKKEQIMGEAYFLRAFHYFNLVRLWGNVPLVLTETTSLDPDNIKVSKADAAEVYTQIINDFELARELLPTQAPAGGRLSKGAAEAFLAKVALTQSNYTDVITWTEAVMGRGYELLTTYDHLFDQEHKNNAEVILSVQYIGAAEGNPFPELVLPTPEASFEFIKFHTPTPNSLAQFEAGDVRASTAFVERSGTPYLFKWRNGDAFASADHNIIMRYADVLLMRAEALNQEDRTTEAIILLDQIRHRAGLTPYTGDQSKEAVDTAILQERRVELMYEGHRWFDLKRKGFQFTRDAILAAKGITITENQMEFSIPQEEIDRNSNLDN